MKPRTLYECSHTKVKGARIRCKKGYQLSLKSEDGTLHIKQLARGDSLTMGICQECHDFDIMGNPIPKSERGWRTSDNDIAVIRQLIAEWEHMQKE